MISIVIASYKYGHLAAHAIESVLEQTLKPTKVLFVDDAAGDCAHLPAIYPEVEFVLREKNMGVVANFNDMLARVETPRVMFLGADNWLEDNCLEEVSKHQADIVSYDIKIVGEHSGPLALVTKAENRIWHGAMHGSSLYSVELARAVGGYERNHGTGHTEEDSVMFKKMLAAGATHSHIQEPFLCYRRHRLNGNKP